MHRPVELAAFACAFALAIIAAAPTRAGEPDTLRVCADPNNLPFSDSAGAGFENKLADLIAQKLGKTVTYSWWAQRRGFIRHTLKAGTCDIVIGVPGDYDLVETTGPYYRSTYVFVSQTARHLDISSISDRRLRTLKIGVHLIGDDGNNTPPAHALGAQHIVDNVQGFMIYGDYREPDPPARLIEAVENGEIDVAAAWGPLAGYAARQSKVQLTLATITGGEGFAPQRFQFDIAMGVRKGDHGLRERVDDFIATRQPDIDALLHSYGVPLMPLARRAAAAGGQP